MTQPPCDICARPMPDTAYVCPRCADALAKDLARIVDLAGEVEAAVAKLTSFGGRLGSSGHKERPLPVDLKAGERAAAIGNTVATWARHVSESRGKPIAPRLPDKPVVFGPLCYHGTALPSLLDSLGLPPCRHGSCEEIRPPRPVVGVAAAAAWLAERDQLEWLRHRREAAEAFGQLIGAARDLERLVGRPRDLWYAGPCYAELANGDRCEAEIYAVPGKALIRCRECGAEWDAEARREWLLEEARDQLLHAEWIARALTALGVEDLTGSRVRGMARHGRLVAKGTNAAGDPVYRVGDVLDVIDEQARIEEDRRRRREAKAARRTERQREAMSGDAA